jgi:hypothetical protein
VPIPDSDDDDCDISSDRSPAGSLPPDPPTELSIHPLSDADFEGFIGSRDTAAQAFCKQKLVDSLAFVEEALERQAAEWKKIKGDVIDMSNKDWYNMEEMQYTCLLEDIAPLQRIKEAAETMSTSATEFVAEEEVVFKACIESSGVGGPPVT